MNKAIKITAVIIVWLVLSIMTYGIVRYKDEDGEMDGDEVFWMGVILACWPIFLIKNIGYFLLTRLLKKLAILGELVGGFMYGLLKRKDNNG